MPACGTASCAVPTCRAARACPDIVLPSSKMCSGAWPAALSAAGSAPAASSRRTTPAAGRPRRARAQARCSGRAPPLRVAASTCAPAASSAVTAASHAAASWLVRARASGVRPSGPVRASTAAPAPTRRRTASLAEGEGWRATACSSVGAAAWGLAAQHNTARLRATWGAHGRPGMDAPLHCNRAGRHRAGHLPGACMRHPHLRAAGTTLMAMVERLLGPAATGARESCILAVQEPVVTPFSCRRRAHECRQEHAARGKRWKNAAAGQGAAQQG